MLSKNEFGNLFLEHGLNLVLLEPEIQIQANTKNMHSEKKEEDTFYKIIFKVIFHFKTIIYIVITVNPYYTTNFMNIYTQPY